MSRVITEDIDKNEVNIDGQKVKGFILDEVCDICGSKKVYYEKYDAKFCSQCNEWKEIGCADTNCEYCRQRPSRPLNTSDFQIFKEITYDNISDIIDELFPEYIANSRYYDPDDKELKYIHLGNLCLMIFEDLDKKKDIDIAIRLVKLANYIINNYGGELQNLFCIEVLEVLTGSRKGAHLAKEYLNGEALEIFHETTKFYHTNQFLDEYYKVFDQSSITVSDPLSMWEYMVSELKRPSMNPPQNDNFLSDIRTDLELDEGLIAGTLSYLKSGSFPSVQQIKNLRQAHRSTFRDYKQKLRQYKSNSVENNRYIEDVINFINDIGRIAASTDIWIWNNFHK